MRDQQQPQRMVRCRLPSVVGAILVAGLARGEDAPAPKPDQAKPPAGTPGAAASRITVTATQADPLYSPLPYSENQTFLRDAPLQRQLSIREAMDLPGVLGDPIKAVSTLPGVVTGSGGELFFHGSKDGESSPTIDHLPVGYLFHLDGIHSVMSPEAVDQLDVYLGGFDTTYGDAIGGVIDVMPRYPVGIDGAYVHLGLLDSAAGFEVGLGRDWALSLHARRSYLDLVIPADALDDSESDTTVTTFPNYTDVNAMLVYRAGGHRFSLETLFAHDEFGINTQDNAVKDPAATGDVNARYGFSSTGLRWRYENGDYRANTLLGYLYQWQRFSIFAGYFFTQKSHTGTLYHLSSWRRGTHDLSAGLEVQRQYLPIDAVLPVPPSEDQVDFDLTSAPTYRVEQVLQPTVYSIFVQDLWRFAARWRARLGVRGEYSDLGDRPARAMPRGALIHDLTDSDSLSASAGLYSARPEPYKRFDQIGNPALGDETAVHYGLAWNHHASELGTWTIEPYYKRLDHLAVAHGGDNYRDDGEGTAWGVDVSWRLRGPSWYLSLSYAFQQAQRQLASDDQRTYSFYGDVPHSLQLAGSWRFAPGWSTSFLAKYTSGQPFTPVVGTYLYTDTNGNTRLRPIYGEPYSERFPAYFTLNHRVSWATRLQGGEQVEVGIEILNLTNHRNVIGIQYNDQYEKERDVTGLGLLPSLDVTVRF
jgi:hypothetical protein